MPRTQRKLVALDVTETSGVDHPAHLHEGWLVMKSAGKPGDTDEEENVPDEPTEVDDLRRSNEDLAKRVAELTKALEDATPKPEPTEEDLVKAAPPAVQQMLTKAREAEAELKKERDAALQKAAAQEEARLDSEAIEKAAGYKDLGLNPEDIGPQLRRLDSADPDLAKAVRGALDGAKARRDEVDLFKSIGSSATVPAAGSAYGEMMSLAKAMVADGHAATTEQAIASIAETNPALMGRYTDEKRGA